MMKNDIYLDTSFLSTKNRARIVLSFQTKSTPYPFDLVCTRTFVSVFAFLLFFGATAARDVVHLQRSCSRIWFIELIRCPLSVGVQVRLDDCLFIIVCWQAGYPEASSTLLWWRCWCASPRPDLTQQRSYMFFLSVTIFKFIESCLIQFPIQRTLQYCESPLSLTRYLHQFSSRFELVPNRNSLHQSQASSLNESREQDV